MNVGNPCTKTGPQFFPIAAVPHCYIHCSNGEGRIRACSEGLLWNTEFETCDWPIPTKVEPVPEKSVVNPFVLKTMEGFTSPRVNSYGRMKRATKERKKRFMPFLPEYLDIVHDTAPLGKL